MRAKPKKLPPLRFVVYAAQEIPLIPLTDMMGNVMQNLWCLPGGRDIRSTDELEEECKRRGLRHKIVEDYAYEER